MFSLWFIRNSRIILSECMRAFEMHDTLSEMVEKACGLYWIRFLGSMLEVPFIVCKE